MNPFWGKLSTGIAAKLLLVNIFIFFVFGLVGATVFYAFRSIEGFLTSTIVRDVNESIENAGLLKDISTVFGEANYIGSTFYKNERLLEEKTERLLRDTHAIEQKSTYLPFKKSLGVFVDELQKVFGQCAEINRILRKSEKIERDLEARLASLEKLVSGKKVQQVLAGEAPVFLEQLGVLLSGYRETLLEINIAFQKIPHESTIKTHEKPAGAILSKIDDLTLRFQTLSASEPEIASHGSALIELMKRYRSSALTFADAFEELQKRRARLSEAEASVLLVMKEIDQHIATSTLHMRHNISEIMRSANRFILVTCITVFFFLGSVTIFFIITNIRQPMQAIGQGIESIRSGNLDTKIDMHRHDEWNLIESAINRMVYDLQHSYSELMEKNQELELTKKELQEKVIELMAQGEERKRLEAQLLQAQKMEAIGTLSGGIAHDFNNILTAIIGYGNILQVKIAEDSPLRGHIDQILSSAERAANLTRSLLAFSRKQEIDLKPVNLNETVRNVERFLSRIIGEDVDLKTELAPEDLIVMADNGQMEQVLMNFATNARDAMPDGGTLSIRTEAVSISEGVLRAFVAPGSYAVISVSDTGIGMDAETRRRLFEPFFTTKEMGKGTGLGLAIVYGILKQHGAEINVYSEPGKGTTFKIYLKRLDNSASGQAPELKELLIGGTETILVAEDDASVRSLIRSILTDYGYTIIEAVDGVDAVAKYREEGEHIDLLFFDVVMPRMNGREAYSEICAIKDNVPVLFSSGYTADVIEKKGMLDVGEILMSKPITPHALLKKVREILDCSSA